MSISYTRMLQFYQHFSRFYCSRFAPLLTDLDRWLKGGYRVMLYCGNPARAEKMRELLSSEGFVPRACPPAADLLKGVTVLDEELELPEGGDTLDEPLQNLPELPEGEEYEPEEEIIEEDVFID